MGLTLIFKKHHSVDHLSPKSSSKQVWAAMSKTNDELVEDGKAAGTALKESRQRAVDKIGKDLVAPGREFKKEARP